MPEQAMQQKIEEKISGGREWYFEAGIESTPGFLFYYRLSLQCRANLLVFDNY